ERADVQITVGADSSSGRHDPSQDVEREERREIGGRDPKIGTADRPKEHETRTGAQIAKEVAAK
ncbi:MAG: hypothetical protein ABIU95_14005, partial [Burkholderiales bacterium]